MYHTASKIQHCRGLIHLFVYKIVHVICQSMKLGINENYNKLVILGRVGVTGLSQGASPGGG